MRPILLLVLVSTFCLAACGPAVTAAPAQPSQKPGAVAPGQQPAAGGQTAGMAGVHPNPGATQGPFGGADLTGYTNDKVGFSIQFPMVWQTADETANPVIYEVPASVGTTLVRKTFEILTTANATTCKETTYSSATASTSPEKVTINGVDFLKETGSDIGAGNIHDWTSYSVMKGSTCINLTFVLHSVAAGVYSTEPAPFDKVEETKIFDLMISTFQLQ